MIALLALWVFYEPLKKSLDRVSRGEAEEVSVGPINVQFSPSAVRRLTLPSPEVAQHVQALSDRPYDREMLLSLGFLTSHPDSCTIDGFQQAVLAGTREANDYFATRLHNLEEYRKYIGAHRRLEQMGLVELVTPSPREIKSDITCAPGQQRKARVTGPGLAARKYYLDLVDSALSIQLPGTEPRND